jgi:hypothetical protein
MAGRGPVYGAAMLLAWAAALGMCGCIMDLGRARLQLPPAEDASEDVSDDVTETETEGDGEPGFPTWAVTVGSTGNSEPRCIRATSDGNFIAVGYSDSTVWAAHHVAVIKLKDSGEPDWLWAIGGMQDDEGVFVDETAAGTYRIVGWTESGGAGGRDAMLLELQEGGAIVSLKAYGTAEEETVRGAASTFDGGLAVCGSRVLYGGDPELFVMKLSSGGDPEWARTTSHPDPVRAFAVAQDPEGDFFVAGSVAHPGSDDDILILRMDSTGGLMWSKRLVRYPDGEDKVKAVPDGTLLDQTILGGSGLDFGLHAMPDPEGGLTLFGSTSSYGNGGQDLWLLGLDASLDVLWQKTYGGPDTECGEENFNLVMGVDRVGVEGFILACGTQSYGVDALDAWFLRVGPEGFIEGDCQPGMIGGQAAEVTAEDDRLEDVDLSLRNLAVQMTGTTLSPYVANYETSSQCAN